MPDDLNFCARCGAPLQARHEGMHIAAACTNPECGRVSYRNAKPCAGVLIEQEGRLLLVKRAIDPFKGAWDVPGGFLEEWEHPADGARREAREETGLAVELTALLGIFVDRYGDAGYNTLNIYYRARPTGGRLAAADDASQVEWFAANALPEHIAFPDHEREVLAVWQAALRADPRPAPSALLQAYVSSRVLGTSD